MDELQNELVVKHLCVFLTEVLPLEHGLGV